MAASVLIVDDEEGFRDLLMYELSSFGYRVTVAGDGLEAVEKASKEHFDVAVTDFTMPKMSGLETLTALKKVDSKIEVILATGYITAELAQDCLSRGAFDHISKPFQVNDLCSLIERAVKGKV
jgi:two-component system response regulator PilR (NtrC family)